jgi:N-acetylhexosamine 1-kinase
VTRSAGPVAPEPVPAGMLEAFAPGRRAVTSHRVGVGHIHRTRVVALDDGRRLVCQRLNTVVFPDLDGLTANWLLVADAAEAAGVRTPRLLPASGGGHLWRDRDGQAWRAYEELPGVVADPTPDDLTARAVAAHVGRFDAACRRLDPAALAVTVPRFHDLDDRAARLARAVDADPAGRVGERAAEIDDCFGLLDAVRGTEAWAAWAELPTRIAHNDAKGANVVLDPAGRPAGVLDLDTVMAGTVLADVGELVRSGTRAGAEDVVGPPVAAARTAAVVDGFLAGWGEPLDAAERAALPIAGAVLTLENAVRFLDDHLAGDVYFAVADPGQNLRRHRAAAAQVRALLAAAGLPSPRPRGTP